MLAKDMSTLRFSIVFHRIPRTFRIPWMSIKLSQKSRAAEVPGLGLQSARPAMIEADAKEKAFRF